MKKLLSVAAIAAVSTQVFAASVAFSAQTDADNSNEYVKKTNYELSNEATRIINDLSGHNENSSFNFFADADKTSICYSYLNDAKGELVEFRETVNGLNSYHGRGNGDGRKQLARNYLNKAGDMMNVSVTQACKESKGLQNVSEKLATLAEDFEKSYEG